MVAMTRPAVFAPTSVAENAFWGVESQFWTELLKEGFNCPYLPPAWYLPRNDPW